LHSVLAFVGTLATVLLSGDALEGWSEDLTGVLRASSTCHTHSSSGAACMLLLHTSIRSCRYLST